MEKSLNEIIEHIELDEYKKILLKRRFVQQVVLYDKKARTVEIFFLTISIFVTIGSIILPALLSIQQLDFSENDDIDELYRKRVFWVTWGLSLLVSICNGLSQLLSLNKQYVSYNTTREKMLSEGWQYFQLSGDYIDTNHEESFPDFCEEIEKIKKNQVDKDFLFINAKIQTKKDKKKLNNDNSSTTISNNTTLSNHTPFESPNNSKNVGLSTTLVRRSVNTTDTKILKDDPLLNFNNKKENVV